jgi:hypothetical protein
MRIAHGDYEGLQQTLEQTIAFSEERGAEYVGSPGKMLLGAVLAAQGELSRGMKLLEGSARYWEKGGSRLRYTLTLLIMGRIYALIAQGTGQRSFSVIFRNLGFVIRKGLFADRKAVQYLTTAIELASEMGAKDTLGRACLTLGILHQAKRRYKQARECLSCAVHIFEECEADEYLKKAKEALDGLA